MLPHLVSECYELVEAVEQGDRAGLVEELGDVLLQVLMHARIAEDGADPFGIDEVASALVDKLVRRHPHVFADATSEDVERLWDEIKRGEKPQRRSALDGIPAGMPALARAEQVRARAHRSGIGAPLPDADDPDEVVGRALLDLVLSNPGVDHEGALRRAASRWEDALRAAESG
jgi:XTP/dITP diphosphohydrolase